MYYLFSTNRGREHLTAKKALKNFTVKEEDLLEKFAPADALDFNFLYVDRHIPLEENINCVFKRIFDVVGSCLLIIFLFSWLFPIIALLIKLDSKGPILFFQRRNKKNGKLFTCVKFRTMIVNDKADVLGAIENDFRITKIGWFLRKHHLDELPQLLNVICGDMSLVGPRPYMVSDNDKYGKLIKDYRVRQKIKPGITGMAQVINYANPINGIEYMEQRVKKDIYYVYNWSFLLDIKIVVLTFFKMTGLKKYG